ncbi:MAG: MBL fold metallo-hydrolase [Desulfurella sp.]|uniref:MBL fold metallo-hydrolase n=1 Tax=Desulfurella sp. TaxID=1962857 RepID=UPI003D0F5AA1
MKLITLVENTSTGGTLKAEHGLSVLIESENSRVLFDTGQSDCIIHNAKTLNVNLQNIDKIVLSHGHYDHVGGLKYVLQYAKAPIIAHPEIFRKRYSKKGDKLRYIGIEDKSFFEHLGAHFEFSTKPQQVSKNIYTTGFVELKTDFEEVDKDFVFESNGQHIKDDVPDDLSLILDLKEGLFIVFGCAHRGIINIINHCENTFNKKVIGFIGGTHLGPASKFQKEKTVETLKTMQQLKIIGPSHCTGIAMTCALANEFPDKIIYNNVGTVIDLGD